MGPFKPHNQPIKTFKYPSEHPSGFWKINAERSKQCGNQIIFIIQKRKMKIFRKDCCHNILKYITGTKE